MRKLYNCQRTAIYTNWSTNEKKYTDTHKKPTSLYSLQSGFIDFPCENFEFSKKMLKLWNFVFSEKKPAFNNNEYISKICFEQRKKNVQAKFSLIDFSAIQFFSFFSLMSFFNVVFVFSLFVNVKWKKNRVIGAWCIMERFSWVNFFYFYKLK